MKKSQKGFALVAVIAIIAATLAGAGFLVYWQTHKQQVASEQPPVVENNNSGNNVNLAPDVEPIQTDPNLEPGMENNVPGNMPDNAKKICPAIAYPGPDFCPGGEILAKSTNGCVVGYDCKKGEASDDLKRSVIINTPEPVPNVKETCAKNCAALGYSSGYCGKEIANPDGSVTACNDGEYPFSMNNPEARLADCAAVDLSTGMSTGNICCCKGGNPAAVCVAQNNSCCKNGMCATANLSCADGAPVFSGCNDQCQPVARCLAVNNSCVAKADCVDDATTCHACVNAAWLKQNPGWSVKNDCKGIGAAVCECQGGKCVAVGE